MSKDQINDPNLKEGDRVTVILTGEVVGRGTTFLTIKVDGQEDKPFGAEKLIYIWRENDSVEVVKQTPSLKVGDKVRQTSVSPYLTTLNPLLTDWEGEVVKIREESVFPYVVEFPQFPGSTNRFPFSANEIEVIR